MRREDNVLKQMPRADYWTILSHFYQASPLIETLLKSSTNLKQEAKGGGLVKMEQIGG